MLKLENITYKKNGKTILDNINLNIESGKLFVITGPNGSGKSTLAKIRIEIALILYKNGILNIFDEPEAGIDLWSFDNLIKIFKNKNKNKTTIIISHQEKILKQADEIIILNNGKISNNKHFLKNIKKPCKNCKEVNHE